ncbi:MAG: WecB/TagA/CpsF family glycosyltransferase [Acidobacteriota bacterium]
MTRREITLLGVRIDNVRITEAVDQLLAASAGPTPTRAAFVNADCINIARRQPAYRDALRHTDLVYADGSGLRLAGRWSGQPVCDNVNGTDLFPLLCARLDDAPQRLFLYGARPGVAEGVADWIRAQFPGVAIAGTLDGFSGTASDAADTIRRGRHYSPRRRGHRAGRARRAAARTLDPRLSADERRIAGPRRRRLV